MKKRKVIISDRATNSLKRIITKLQRNGYLGADKAKEAIIKRIKFLANHPEKDSRVAKFGRIEGDIRSVLAWNYRIYYLIAEEEIKVLDIFLDQDKEVKL
ncbi:MAG: type II toxin-antitoxin system RelE/ParE family toxin [Flavobacteriales bacterium]